MSKPTANWDRVGNSFYRKVQLYTDVFDQDLELENHLIAGAPYSGALALHRDESKIYTYRPSEASKSSIDLYTCAGKLIRQLSWDKGPIKGLGWSEDEELLVVAQDGTVRCYTDLSDDFTPFSLGHGVEEHGVVACKFWLTGFVALLGNNELVAVSRYDEPRPKLLAAPPSDEVISWTVIPPAYTLSRSVEVLLAIGQTINVVDASDSEDRLLQNGPFRHISVSPNGKFIALYTDDGKVWVISSDFQDKLSEYDTRSKTVPKDMQWCGNDAVVLAWEDEVHLVGPNGSASKYYYDAWVHLVADVDGIRFFTNELCEFLQKVPDVTEDTFKIGSTSPAAVLFDAVEQLEKMSPKADDNVQLIKPYLPEAIDSCIAAAGNEYDASMQKKLLKAASFGKTVLDSYDSDEFVNMCETIRILNAIRFFEIGLPLSHEQYIRLSPERLLQRLITRDQYLLALRIGEYLRLPRSKIYEYWARRKVRVSIAEDETTSAQIVAKVDSQPGISYEEIARTAFNQGRQRLATDLLNHEQRAGRQVKLLLDMGEDTIALDKAIESGDTDLVLSVLLQLRRKLPLATFFRTINTRPVASALVESTARDQDLDLLKDLYYQDDRRLDGANLLFADALRQPDTQHKTDRMRSAAKLLSDSKEYATHTRAVEEAARLLRAQEALDADPKLTGDDAAARHRFTGLSLNQTIHRLILSNEGKRAAQIMADFKVPERAQWWLRLRALVAARAWREIEAIAAKNRKSPIGWEPFVTEILGAGNAKLAGGTFVPKCTNLGARERMDLYVKCAMVVRAGEEAVKAKDREWLEGARDKAEGRDKVELERLVGQLAKGR